MYKICYKNEDANYPAFETEEKALDFYVKEVQAVTGEGRDEILSEDWPSPTGVKACVEVREVEDEDSDR